MTGQCPMNRGSIRKITDKSDRWSIFQRAMFDYWRVVGRGSDLPHRTLSADLLGEFSSWHTVLAMKECRSLNLETAPKSYFTQEHHWPTDLSLNKQKIHSRHFTRISQPVPSLFWGCYPCYTRAPRWTSAPAWPQMVVLSTMRIRSTSLKPQPVMV